VVGLVSAELVAALRAAEPYLRDIRKLPLSAALFGDAADEIDRLRGELAGQAARAEKAEAAIARVREACVSLAGRYLNRCVYDHAEAIVLRVLDGES
jgi:hypothetical protein